MDEKNVEVAQSALSSAQSPHSGHDTDSRRVNRMGRSTPTDAHVAHTAPSHRSNWKP